ncbi:MAG: hypothetical protein FWD38_06225 [Oscillospiraceae bacterium]|nr:hypothetical protein [Oscillospiraceae bacterium]
MTENCKLIPSVIIEQSNSAITILQTDNENLKTANNALLTFITDHSNRGISFNSAKLKMEDYHRVSNALENANDADISDHGKLISMVGNIDFIGADILRELSNSKTERDNATSWIAHYEQIRSSTTFLQRLFSKELNAVHSAAGTSLNTQKRIQQNANEVIRYLEEKAENFTQIENTTKNLFTLSITLRTEAKHGIALIEEAASNLPNSYNNAALSSWRIKIENSRETLFNAVFERLVIRDGYGNIIGFNLVYLEAMLSKEVSNITPWEYNLLIKLLTDTTNPDALQDLFKLLTVPVLMCDIRELCVLRRFNHELINNLEALMIGSILANVTFESNSDLNHMMQVATILGFIGSSPAPFGRGYDNDFLNLTRNENGDLILYIKQFRDRPWESTDITIHLEDYSQWRERDITFSKATWAGNGNLADLMINKTNDETLRRYSVDVDNIFLNGLFEYGSELFNGLLGFAGEIPIIGTPIGIATATVDTGQAISNMTNAWINGYSQRQRESIAKLNDITAITEAWSISSIAQTFKLTGVVISEPGMAAPLVSLFPGERNTTDGIISTQNIIDGINRELQNAINNPSSKFNIAQVTADLNEKHGTNVQLNYPFNIGDLFENLPFFADFYKTLNNGGYYIE